MSKMSRMVLFLFVLMAVLGGTARAGDDPAAKLGRGAENILTSPLEFLIQYKMAAEENGGITTFVKGTLYGLGMTAVRILGGAYEIVTFPIPVPENYAPLMDPATPLKALHQLSN